MNRKKLFISLGVVTFISFLVAVGYPIIKSEIRYYQHDDAWHFRQLEMTAEPHGVILFKNGTSLKMNSGRIRRGRGNIYIVTSTRRKFRVETQMHIAYFWAKRAADYCEEHPLDSIEDFLDPSMVRKLFDKTLEQRAKIRLYEVVDMHERQIF